MINLKEGIGDKAYDTYLKKIDEYTIEGYRFSKGWSPRHKVFFTLKCDQPIESLAVFNDDEDQTRWFYFKSNGKKVKAENGDTQKSKTINGKKYEFDQYGAMTAEWSLDVDTASTSGLRGDNATATHSVSAQYAKQWRYFQDVENGARVSKLVQGSIC